LHPPESAWKAFNIDKQGWVAVNNEKTYHQQAAPSPQVNFPQCNRDVEGRHSRMGGPHHAKPQVAFHVNSQPRSQDVAIICDDATQAFQHILHIDILQENA